MSVLTLEQAQKVAELASELVVLKERTEAVQGELLAVMGNVQEVAPVARTVARPPKAAKTITVVGRGAKKVDDGKQPDLPTLLSQIAADQKKPLKIAEFVTLARASGYQSEAGDFPNMVYQALLKLVKRGVLSKDKENRDYHYVGKAA